MSDQNAIRAVIEEWLAASKAGDLEKLLTLMTDDILFITRNGNMRRGDFVTSFKSMSGKVEIDGRPEIQEITVEGNKEIWRSAGTS